jgi:ABC-2 type transport system permease protein
MAVYKRTYKGYTGELTPAWSRFLILPRYSYSRLFHSKFLIMFLVACFFYPIGCAGFIYLSHNLSFLKTFNVQAGRLLEINANFFLYYCSFQGAMAFLLTTLVGPSLVSPDLANNALPLYFSRPFSRIEYVAGKMSVLLMLLSTITWIPGLILYAIQASQAGWEWTRANLWIAGSIFIGLVIWITVLSLIALALSAWVKWKIAAGGLILGVFFAGAGFAAAINAVMRTHLGALIDLRQIIYVIWMELFRIPAADLGITVFDAWVALLVACAICGWLLFRRVRAFEVVK